jgi:hypothetical protein
MMSFTADGQLDPQLLAQRDSMASVDSGARGRVLLWVFIVKDILRAARRPDSAKMRCIQCCIATRVSQRTSDEWQRRWWRPGVGAADACAAEIFHLSYGAEQQLL